MWRHTLLLIACLIATRAATISGKVWGDLNGDYFDDTNTGKHMLFVDENRNCKFDDVGQSLGMYTLPFIFSNNEGEFTFEVLDNGTYDIIMAHFPFATTVIFPPSLIELASPPETSTTDPTSTCRGYRVTVSDSSDNIKDLNFGWALDVSNPTETEIVSQAANIRAGSQRHLELTEGSYAAIKTSSSNHAMYSLFQFNISAFGNPNTLIHATLEITVALVRIGSCDLDLSLSSLFNPDTVTFSDVTRSARIGSVETTGIGSYQFDVLTELKNAVWNDETEIAFNVECNTSAELSKYWLSEADTTLTISRVRSHEFPQE